VRAILIAAKHLAFAKTRLGRAVGDADRMALAEAMFRDVLCAALSARVADHVAVISSDPTLLEMACTAGALVIDEEFPTATTTLSQIGRIDFIDSTTG
jgi:2-phospho-L-lactate guanylyltransferase (CobY/MobA/RfbA family)